MMDENNRAAASQQIRLHQLVYPDERVVVFLAKNYSARDTNKQRRALDVGCGSGRHLRLLLDYGFQSYGIDYSQDAIDVARNLVDKHPLYKELKAVDLAVTPYPDSFFQVVICWGAIFLRPVNEMLKDLQTIYRLLCTGGQAVVNFRSKENWFYGKGISQDGEETYLLDENAGPYKSMRYTFVDLDQAKTLLKNVGFEIENSERVDLWERNCTKQHSWWVFWVRKPGS